MTLIEHGELVRRALEYVQEERCRRPVSYTHLTLPTTERV